MHVSAVVLLSGLSVASAFFGSRSSPPDPPSDFVRGAPELEEYRKTSATFTCRDNSATLNFSCVNDDYCDCRDGSDEPGTSACSGRFICANKGFRSTSIPSSRVEDRICDCCDGSDETNIKCPNVCASLAKEEHQKFEAVLAEFRQGSKIRSSYEADAKSKVDSLRFKLAQLREEGKELNIRVNATTAVYDIERQFELDINTQLTNNATMSIHSALSLHDMEERSLAQFISHLMDLLNLGPSDVRDIQSSLQKGENWRRATSREPQPLPDEDEEGHYDRHEDPYDDYDQESHHDLESEHHDTAEEQTEIADCGADAITSDARIQMLICDGGVDAMQTLRTLLVHLIRSQKSLPEVQTIIGFYKLHGTFEGIEQFLKQSPPVEGTCPAEFAALPGVCEVPSQLSAILHEMDVAYASEEASRAKEAMDTAVRLRDENIRARKEVKEQIRLYDSLEANGQGALIEVKDKCFKVKDGKFEYEVCYLGSIFQTSLEQGGGRTLLGSFSSVQDTPEGDVMLFYEHGQHCHAFGARKASVHVTCGRADEVIEAREPSTCAYSFRMKSPLACTAKYGLLQGLM